MPHSPIDSDRGHQVKQITEKRRRRQLYLRLFNYIVAFAAVSGLTYSLLTSINTKSKKDKSLDIVLSNTTQYDDSLLKRRLFEFNRVLKTLSTKDTSKNVSNIELKILSIRVDSLNNKIKFQQD